MIGKKISSPSDQHMRITIFSSEYPPCWGGAGRHVQSLCRHLSNRVQLRLVTTTFGEPRERFAVTNLARIRVRSYPLLLAQYLGGVLLCRYDGSHLIQIHVPHAFTISRKRRIVSTFHLVSAQYSDALRHQRPMSLFDLQYPPINRRIAQEEQRLALKSDAMIAVSKSVKHELVTRYGVSEEKVTVVYNAVNVGRFQPSLNREKLILYVGRQSAHKGLPYLLQAFATFVRNRTDYRLMLIGERLEGGIAPSLVRLTETLRISDKVEFPGRLPEPEVRFIMGRAAFLVLPSLAEGFGMTPLEAMASETPVVATNVGGYQK